MTKRKSFIFICILLSLILGGGLWVHFGFASDEPERQVEIVVPYTEVEWWLSRWSDNQIECVILVDHDGLPTHNEVWYACGETLYDEWVDTPTCETGAGQDPSTCEGLYLFRASKRAAERTIVIELPTPTVWLALAGCTLDPPVNSCEQIPNLVLIGEEPLPNEKITAIHLRYADVVFDCEAARCEFPLPVTTLAGIQVEFWADSSFGDSTEVYTALIRVVDGGIAPGTNQTTWFVDVLSTQWIGSQIAACAQVWDALPPVGMPPLWLTTPDNPEDLFTEEPYAYLAGRLIANGVVDASQCPDRGLLPNGNANTCGLEESEEQVIFWQNQFNPTLLRVSNETTVPAWLLKNQFAIESQFWPGIWLPEEFGFGQMTENGADAPFLYNKEFFNEFCPLVLETSVCEGGYLSLSSEEQLMLRSALATGTDATCAECSLGIDLAQANRTVEVFANTLLGNCVQSGGIIRNETGFAPGEVSSYEDLWRFTLVNYNAGPGCLTSVIRSTWSQNRFLGWEAALPHLDKVCPLAIEYVEQITDLRPEGPITQTPTPTVSAIATPTPTPQATPTTAIAPYPAPFTPTPPYP